LAHGGRKKAHNENCRCRKWAFAVGPVLCYWEVAFAADSVETAGAERPAAREKELDMEGSDRVVRGILIGGALGAFSNIFGYTESMFMAIGVGAVAGFLAGLTHAALDRKRKK
jgi:hypothetical protein